MGDSFYKYNDYELLYLANQNIDEAIELIIWKYSFLVKSRLKKLHVPKELWDDYTQEANIVIVKAIKSFDPKSKLTFTNYLDMLIQSRFITLLRNNERLIIVDEEYLNMIQEDNMEDTPYSLREDDYKFSDFEKLIFKLCFIEGKKVSEVAKITGVENKKISDTKQRILKKMKREIKY